MGNESLSKTGTAGLSYAECKNIFYFILTIIDMTDIIKHIEENRFNGRDGMYETIYY